MTKQSIFQISDGDLGIANRENYVLKNEERIGRVDHPYLIYCGLHDTIGDCSNAAIAHHLGGNQDRARTFGRRVAPAAKDYFFGDWPTIVPTRDGKERIDPEYWYSHSPWMSPFRDALCWAMVLGDRTAAREVAAYPNEKRADEEWIGPECSKARRALFLALARYLRSEQVAKVAETIGKLSGAKWRGTLELAHVFDAVLARDAETAQGWLEKFFTLHHKRKKVFNITDTISIDGTIFYYLAVQTGLAIRLDPKLYVYVIDLEAAGPDAA